MPPLTKTAWLAIRRLRRTPVFTAVALVMLALGIGAPTAVLSVLRVVLFEALPYHEPDRLVAVLGTRDGTPTPSGVVSAPDVVDYVEQSTTIAAIGGVATTRVNLLGVGDPVSLVAGQVTPDFFRTLDQRAALGRLLSADDFSPGAPAVAVLAHATWRSRFGTDSGVIGRTVRFDDVPITIVGVAEPDALQFPDPDIGLWIAQREDNSRGSRNLAAVARLQDGVSLIGAQAELDAVAARLRAAYPESNADRAVVLRPLQEVVTGKVRAPLLLTLAATVLVFLVMCANLGNMLLTRFSGRLPEFAVRLALGAKRRYLVHDVLAESVVLVSGGLVLSLFIATWLVDASLALVPASLPRAGDIAIGAPVLGYALGLAAVTVLIAGVLPSLGIRERRLGELLRSGTRAALGGRFVSRLGGFMVATQVALSAVLLIGAGLLLQSFLRLTHVDTGFAIEQRLTFQVEFPQSRYADPVARRQFVDEATRRIGAVPGVRRVGVSSALPLTQNNLCDDVELPGGTTLGVCAEARTIDLGYLETMRIPLRAGRAFTTADDARRGNVALVNQSLARLAWPGEPPVGRRLSLFGIEFEVVGVIADVRHFGPKRAAPPELYAPIAQVTFPWATFAIETDGDPALIRSSVQRAVWSLDSQLPLRDVATLAALYGKLTGGERFRSYLVGGIAVLALILAGLGVYGLTGFVVAGRTREIGIRMALGANAHRVLRGVLARATGLVLLGLAAGVGLALLAAPWLTPFLFETSSHDATVYVIIPFVFVAAALAAAYGPARRATVVEPVDVLRHD